MKFKATPYEISRKAVESDPYATFVYPGRYKVQKMEDYLERQSIEVKCESAKWACEELWKTFQNIDENWHTPDNKRSLMTGDLARIEDETGKVSWYICASIGWIEIEEPGDAVLEVKKEESK
jgi:hypothetical protein